MLSGSELVVSSFGIDRMLNSLSAGAQRSLMSDSPVAGYFPISSLGAWNTKAQPAQNHGAGGQRRLLDLTVDPKFKDHSFCEPTERRAEIHQEPNK